jgi:phosphoglycolate phosphatase-like HAD superfamily hydrolase
MGGGDTVADIKEGKNAGTWTAAVLSGNQTEEILKDAGPDFVLRSVVDVPTIFG